jgi:hypothetical protein
MYDSYMKTIAYPLAVPSDLLKSLQPFTAEEVRRCFEIPSPEFDSLAAHCASLPVLLTEIRSNGWV